VTCGNQDHDSRCYGYFDAHHDSGYRQTFGDYGATGEFTCEDWT
jgi:hypothetical protein